MRGQPSPDRPVGEGMQAQVFDRDRDAVCVVGERGEMRINFDNIPMLLSSELFKKDLKEILINCPQEKNEAMEDFFAPAFIFLAIAICADKKGWVKSTDNSMLKFINSNIEYLKTLLLRIFSEDELQELWKNE